MKLYAIRLRPGQDLKRAIEGFVEEKGLSSATVVSGVGSLSQARIRMAGERDMKTKEYDEFFEVVSLTGNLGPGRTHLHLSVADKEGNVIGGHLKEGNIVQTTIELVVVSDEHVRFSEESDPNTHFDELKVTEL